MSGITRRVLAAAALLAALAATSAWAQPAQTTRLRGTIDKVVVDESTIDENKPPLLVYREAARKA